MLSKKIMLPFLLLSILGASGAHASDTTDKIKAGSSIAAGLAAGAAVGKVLPGSLPAKIVAGAATTALVTPWLLLLSVRGRFNSPLPKTWQDKVTNEAATAIFLGHPIAAPALAITTGICVGQALPTNTPLKILAGSTIAAGITAAGTALWTMIVAAAAMAGGTGKG